ncbi:hypothetical protein HMPREF9954_1856 [Streptococcus infantis SK970]|nr:hypothetical protein HMPREF9954_1856 [Streptococcus infantis SK970]
MEQERKEAEENLQKQIGKIYVQIKLKKIKISRMNQFLKS